MKKQIITCGVAVLVFVLVCCGSVVAGGPWKGRIVDVETKEPLEGAVVLAVWYRVYRTPYGDNAYFYEAKEVLTDQAGELVIRRYTPINLLPIISYMRGPEFTIFKPGYGSLSGLALGEYLVGGATSEQEIERSGKKYRLSSGLIELPKLMTREERLQHMPSPIGDTQLYNRQKLFIGLINNERRNLGLKGMYKIEEGK